MKLFKALAAISFFSMLTRLLGFGLRIFMSRELDAEGMGIYQVAFSAFIVLLTFVSSGIPLVVSRDSAKLIAGGEQIRAHKTVSAALLTGTLVSIFICLIVVAARKQIGQLLGNDESLKILLMLLPAVLASGIYAAFHGALWGGKRYFLSSFNEFLEQVSRIFLCVFLFKMTNMDKAVAAGLSLSAACIVSMLIGIIMYFYYGGKLRKPHGEFKPLLKSATPITGIRLAGSLINALVAIILPARLMASGMSNAEALAALGCMAGMVFPLLFLPGTFIGALASVLVPELSESRNDPSRLRRKIETSIAFSIMITVVFVPLFWGIGRPLGAMVYDNEQAGLLLSHSALLMLPIALEQIASSMMNSLDLEFVGFINYLVGAAIMILCIVLLSPFIGIYSFIVGMLLDLGVAGILDVIAIKKKTGISLSFVKPSLIACMLIIPGTGLCVSLFRLMSSLPIWINMTISSITSMLAVALMCYCLNLFEISGLILSRKKKIKAEINV